MRALAAPGQCVKRELCVSVESLIGACASTDSLHDVPKILFVCTGSSADVGVFEKNVGWCDDELFRRVKDRINRR